MTRVLEDGYLVIMLKLTDMKKVIILLVALIIFLVGVVTYFFLSRDDEVINTPNVPENTQTNNNATSTPEVDDGMTVIGTSTQGRAITAYHYGEGEEEVVFVGGIHGGYSWNTALVAYELMDYLEGNAANIPENVKVTVIPVLNPDGLQLVAGTSSRFAASDVDKAKASTIDGRLNGNDVDLNRNFDCDWQTNGTWQSRTVSGGTRAFSEPESAAIRDYILANDPASVVVWYSAAGGVFSSNCHGEVLPETRELTKTYAEASGYRAFEEFDFYEITGDMVNWLAKEGVPAISVLLTNHTDTEWSKNRAGVEALLEYYAKAE